MKNRGFAPIFIIIFVLVVIVATSISVFSEKRDDTSDISTEVPEEIGDGDTITLTLKIR